MAHDTNAGEYSCLSSRVSLELLSKSTKMQDLQKKNTGQFWVKGWKDNEGVDKLLLPSQNQN